MFTSTSACFYRVWLLISVSNFRRFKGLAIDQQFICCALPTDGNDCYVMHMSRILTSLLVVALSCGFSFAQDDLHEVKVHVLDYRTGHPVKGWEVGLLSLTAKTEKDGVALFRIAGPLPPILSVNPEAGGWSEWSCTDFQSLQTTEVLQSGVEGKFLKHPLCREHVSSTTTPHGGEIVIYVRHLNPWLTFRRVLWEIFYG